LIDRRALLLSGHVVLEAIYIEFQSLVMPTELAQQDCFDIEQVYAEINA
jgi:hypothetical protein